MAKAGRAKAPAILVEKTSRGLAPSSALDFELLSKAKTGQLYELTPRSTARSNPQMRLYWLVLTKICEATDLYPRPEYLHEILMRHCGFVRPVLDPITGLYEETRDSIAFDQMSHEAMNDYTTRAFAKLNEAFGVDVFDLLPPRTGKGDRHEAA